MSVERSRYPLPIAVALLLLAASALSTALLSRQTAAERHWKTARDLERVGRISEALGIYEAIQAELAWNGVFLQRRGHILAKVGRSAAAITSLEAATSLSPSPWLHEELAQVYDELGDWQQAIRHAERAADMLPWRLTPRHHLASIYFRRGDAANAVHWARQVLGTPMKKPTRRGEELKEAAGLIVAHADVTPDELERRIEQAASSLGPEYGEAARRALTRARENALGWLEALDAVPREQREAVVFLLLGAKLDDLRYLPAQLLIHNVTYAYKARAAWAHAREVPEEVFLEYVLPHIQLSESSDDWRPQLYDRFAGLAHESQSVEDAVIRLNDTIYEQLGVDYDDSRMEKSAQSPTESIEVGFVDCIGAAILLADTVRAVGIPARVAFIPMWTNLSGTHAWVEVWDRGRWWHMAAFDEGRFDDTWFTERLAETDPSKPRHRVYAVSYRPTGLHVSFGDDVSFVDVTERYLRK